MHHCSFQLQHLDFVYSKGRCLQNSPKVYKDLITHSGCELFQNCLQSYKDKQSHCLMQIQMVEHYNFYQVSICLTYALEKTLSDHLHSSPNTYKILERYFFTTYGELPFLQKPYGGIWTCFITYNHCRKFFKRSCDVFFNSYCNKVKECLQQNMAIQDTVGKNIGMYNGLPMRSLGKWKKMHIRSFVCVEKIKEAFSDVTRHLNISIYVTLKRSQGNLLCHWYPSSMTKITDADKELFFKWLLK